MQVSVAGTHIAYHDVGAGDPVILLHGSAPGATALQAWSPTLNAVAAMGYRAIAPDIVGFGGSGRPVDFSYDMRGWVASVQGFMSVLGLESAHIVGNSMGGRIALSLACLAPDRTRSLTLVGVRAPGDDALGTGLSMIREYEPSLANMRRLMREFLVADPACVTDEMIATRYAKSMEPGEHDHYRRMFAHPGANDVAVTADDLRMLQAPTLIVQGVDDRIVPVAHAHRIAGLIPGAVAVTIGGCGHWPQIEKAEIFEGQLAVFLRRCS